jgi:hypothetical protein
MARRALLDQFQLPNVAYIGCTVTFYTADANGAATTAKATLYDDLTGTGTLLNPQSFDSDGKLAQPTYIEVAVVPVVAGVHFVSQTLGVVCPPGAYRGDWATATIYLPGDWVTDGAAGGNTQEIYAVINFHQSGVWAADSVNANKLRKVSNFAALSIAPDATESVKGKAEIATLPETNTGTDDGRFITPLKLATSNLALAVAANAAEVALLGTYFSGFALANNAGDATHDIDVAVGKARDGADTMNLVTTATIVKQTDVAFAEYTLPGTASGGMDSTTALTGSPATVHVFMIGGSGKNTQPFFSTAISPTLPSGFTAKVYVNSLLWTGATLRPFKQRGRDEIMLVTPVQQSATAVGTAARSITLTAPTGIEMQALIGLCVVAAGAAANHGLSALDVTDLDPSSAGSNGGYPIATATASGVAAISSGWIKTNTSAQIRARASASHASNTEYINSLGWRVMR